MKKQKDFIKKLIKEALIPMDDWGFNTTDEKPIEGVEKPITLTLYRGINNQNELIDNGDDTYTLNVKRYPDKAIWFTRNDDFANAYSGYALLTYKLEAVKHSNVYDKVTSAYGRGEIESDSSNDSPISYGIELPIGWFWSYKAQKHIVCKQSLIIPKNNVEINPE